MQAQYTRAMAEQDAQASGLDAATLQGHVVTLSQQLSEPEMDRILTARQVGGALSGVNRLSKARLLAGVVIPDPPTTDGRLMIKSSTPTPCAADEARAGSLPSLRMAIHSTDADDDDDAAAGDERRDGGDSSVSPPNGWGKVRAKRTALCAASAVDSAMREGPYQTGALRRQVQHLSAAVGPLIGAAVMGAGGAAASVSGAAAAGAAAVGGLTQSMTTHEHHVQAQEMSRKLQRVALEQDRLLHDESQATALRLAQENMALDARLHRQALWKENQLHAAALQQERRLHEASLRVDNRLHYEGILADLREQDREVGVARSCAALPPSPHSEPHLHHSPSPGGPGSMGAADGALPDADDGLVAAHLRRLCARRGGRSAHRPRRPYRRQLDD